MTAIRGLRAYDPEVDALSAPAFRVWARAIELSCQNPKDGELTERDLLVVKVKPRELEELLKVGLWQRRDDGTIVIRDYLRDNPSVAEREAGRRKAAERMRRHRGSSVAREHNSEHDPCSTQCSREQHGELEANGEEPSLPLPPSDPITCGNDTKSGVSSDPSLPPVLTGSPRVSRRRMAKHARPVDWKPNDKHRTRAAKTGLDCDSEAEHFCSHHDREGTWFANWDAGFTTWLIMALKFAKPPGAVQHEKTREEVRKRPCLDFFKEEPEVPTGERLTAAEILAEAKKARLA